MSPQHLEVKPRELRFEVTPGLDRKSLLKKEERKEKKKGRKGRRERLFYRALSPK